MLLCQQYTVAAMSIYMEVGIDNWSLNFVNSFVVLRDPQSRTLLLAEKIHVHVDYGLHFNVILKLYTTFNACCAP